MHAFYIVKADTFRSLLYLQAKESLHGFQLLSVISPYKASGCGICHPNIRVVLREVVLHQREINLALEGK